MIKKHIDIISRLLNQNKVITIIMILIFVFGLIIGFNSFSKFKLVILKLFVSKIGSIVSDNNLVTFFRIFLNNLFVGLLLILLGVTLLFPVLIIFFNGLIMGVLLDLFLRVGNLAISSKLSIISNFILTLLPHGIIEIPALIISSVFGIVLGLKLFFKKKIMKEKNFRTLFVEIFKAYVFIVIPLFIVAAFIESFVTPQVSSLTSIMLTGKITSDSILNDIVLNQRDLSDLGVVVKEIPMKDYIKRTQSVRALNYLNSILVLFYDDEIYNELYKLRDKPTISRIYADDDSNNIIFIQITKFESHEEADKKFTLLQKIFSIMTSENKINAIDVGNNTFKIDYGNNIHYQKLNSINKFFYSIKIFGKDSDLINSIILKQEQKLNAMSRD